MIDCLTNSSDVETQLDEGRDRELQNRSSIGPLSMKRWLTEDKLAIARCWSWQFAVGGANRELLLDALKAMNAAEEQKALLASVQRYASSVEEMTPGVRQQYPFSLEEPPFDPLQHSASVATSHSDPKRE